MQLLYKWGGLNRGSKSIRLGVFVSQAGQMFCVIETNQRCWSFNPVTTGQWSLWWAVLFFFTLAWVVFRGFGKGCTVWNRNGNTFTGHMTYTKSHDMVRYVWTVGETGIFFSTKICLQSVPSRNEGGGAFSRSRGKRSTRNGKRSNRRVKKLQEKKPLQSDDGQMTASAVAATEINLLKCRKSAAMRLGPTEHERRTFSGYAIILQLWFIFTSKIFAQASCQRAREMESPVKLQSFDKPIFELEFMFLFAQWSRFVALTSADLQKKNSKQIESESLDHVVESQKQRVCGKTLIWWISQSCQQRNQI